MFESRLVATIVAGLDIHTGILDPLGANLKPGADACFQLLRRLGDNLADSLADHLLTSFRFGNSAG